MRLRTSALAATAFLVACGGQPANNSQQKTEAVSGTPNRNAASRPDVGVVSSHGGPSQTPAPGAKPAAGGAEKPSVATPELDAKIEKTEAKAKAAGANDADRKAAAAAYFERADFFYNAGNPSLYKFALRDYRIGLRYDPSAAQARARMEEIVGIYRGMGRPVPELGNEP